MSSKTQDQLNGEFQYKQAGSIKKNDFCMLDDHPCKIIELAVSKPGKHGTAKVVFTGVDIFSGKKVEAIQTTSDHVVVPVVKKVELEVADISDDNFVSLILPDASLKEDLKLPNDKKEAKRLKDIYQLNKDENSVYFTFIRACGQEKIISARMEKIY